MSEKPVGLKMEKLLFVFIMFVVVTGLALSRNTEYDSSLVSEHQSLMGQKRDMQDQIVQLTDRLKEVEKMKKHYPEVNFLSYKDRKRILNSNRLFLSRSIPSSRLITYHPSLQVTGGAGFVGSHLVDALMIQGHEVTVADNFFTGRKRNVEHWLGHENFELLNHDIVNPLYLEVDQIYHLASPASPPNYMYNPIKTIKTNTIGTINMLGLAKRVKARFLMASTSEIYGDPEVHPQQEDYWGNVNPIGPRACYDEAKRVAETMCYAYGKQDRVEIRVARIFNTFGPRMHMNDGRVVSNFILQALQNEPITVYGDGEQTRSFQYVTDLVDGLMNLMNSNCTLPVNIGNPDEHTINDFAQIIKRLVGGESEIVHKPAVEDDPHRRRPDITRAKQLISWEPKVPMMFGINKTIEYFHQEINRKKHSERNIWLPEYTLKSYDKL
ncbi:hypothetical protein LSH36_692g01011 [Paralvinella palmiformis]|uniref:UDP-glucuronic acid decarboxylase 1 n=1 Tax=Paralvinella palmiformis TaxID=53620 RepID=A0AAD9J3C9_9ANNE|nr:hypothetical protein LSH36_692g01011 [Paralvinella palmiformis]